MCALISGADGEAVRGSVIRWIDGHVETVSRQMVWDAVKHYILLSINFPSKAIRHKR